MTEQTPNGNGNGGQPAPDPEPVSVVIVGFTPTNDIFHGVCRALQVILDDLLTLPDHQLRAGILSLKNTVERADK